MCTFIPASIKGKAHMTHSTAHCSFCKGILPLCLLFEYTKSNDGMILLCGYCNDVMLNAGEIFQQEIDKLPETWFHR